MAAESELLQTEIGDLTAIARRLAVASAERGVPADASGEAHEMLAIAQRLEKAAQTLLEHNRQPRHTAAARRGFGSAGQVTMTQLRFNHDNRSGL
jgi:hypothetical protein